MVANHRLYTSSDGWQPWFPTTHLRTVTTRYGNLIKNLWSGSSRTIAPLKMRWTIAKFADQFTGFGQHDAQELLAFLLDGLHEDLNR